MTIEEAEKIARLIGSADNGCASCVGNLVKRFNRLFPQFVMTKTREEVRDNFEEPKPSHMDEEEWAEIGDRRIVVTVTTAT